MASKDASADSDESGIEVRVIGEPVVSMHCMLFFVYYVRIIYFSIFDFNCY